MPLAHSYAPWSPADTEKVCPCATACLKMVSSVACEPVLFADDSHTPSDTLMTFATLSLTALLYAAVMAVSVIDGAT